uniref:Uncharacterized protein n=1 Tax=Arundo donax TaxID=35708 RepID=A0A0A9AVJ2_ARUDO
MERISGSLPGMRAAGLVMVVVVLARFSPPLFLRAFL